MVLYIQTTHMAYAIWHPAAVACFTKKIAFILVINVQGEKVTPFVSKGGVRRRNGIQSVKLFRTFWR